MMNGLRDRARTACLLGFLLSCGAANAADINGPAPITPARAPAAVMFEKNSVSDLNFGPPPVRHLSCYAGVFGEGAVSHPAFDNVPVAGAYSEYFAIGGRGGLIGGCDVVFQTRTFLGVDATIAYGQLKGTHAVGFTGNVPFESAARLRLGFMLDPDVSVYVAGGVAQGWLDTVDAAGQHTSGFITGGQVATGFEYRFWSVWRSRMEYAYTYYGSDSTLITGSPLARMNPTSHSIRVALIYLFDPYRLP